VRALVVKPAFHIGQTFVIKVRKANNGANKQENHDELGVHLFASPNLNFTGTNTTPEDQTRLSVNTCVKST
jgi:hypothetical protein